ncbi:P-loop containing nucleoside triphosphate hydrolase protein [Scenedesmus sp. NREL 46B-D3]|nr:P-loop containing nucleoside triphosphate hydrolase protein [Scenedesmus sp. NREL 46B-D3]
MPALCPVCCCALHLLSQDKRLARLAKAREAADKTVLRSPICCILGHVDVGKTKILDNIRRTNVQDGEAGGITQQIGATFVPADAIEKRTQPLRGSRPFDMKLPGLLVIDTPGHESFTNLRARGSGLCDVAVLIVDLMHGLEQQTIESINMLKMRKTPFIIALNKIDRLYQWKSLPDGPVRDAFKRQKEHVMKEFDDRSSQVFLQLNEQGLNVSLYWKNPDPRRYVNVVPTSAITGEGIPDLLQLMVKLTQTMMQDRLTLLSETQCTVLEVKTMEGLGTTVDVVLVNGTLREGDRIVVCGLSGPLVTRIKSLKTPQVMKEMRVKGMLVEHKEVRAAMGVKIVAPGLESAVAGTSLYVIGPEDDEEELKDSVMEDMADIFSKVDKSGEGVCVQASTLGSLEALLSFLDSPEVSIAVSGINIGPVHKRDVLRANVMNEKGAKKFAVILAFDVPVSREAREMAQEYNVRIFTADIIYHLFDQFTAYMKQIKAQEQEAARLEAVFPCTLQIMPTCVFNKKDPIVVGVEVVEGIARVGTPLAVPTQAGIELGRIASLELNHKAVDSARAGQSVAMKIEPGNAIEQSRMYGRHFDHNDQLVSKITRESINALKSHFADEMTKDDWRLVVKLKKVWGVQ